MSGRFAVGDRVVMAASNRRGVVLREWDEAFPQGGVQQVIGVRWEDGTGTAMRAAHFTHQPTDQWLTPEEHEPTVQDHPDGSGA